MENLCEMNVVIIIVIWGGFKLFERRVEGSKERLGCFYWSFVVIHLCIVERKYKKRFSDDTILFYSCAFQP